MRDLDIQKDNIQNIQIVKPPKNSPDTIKRKKKLIVVLATMVGLFMMLFISFLLEYIYRNKKQKLSAD